MIKFPHIDNFKSLEKNVKTKTDFKGFDENGVPIYRHDELYPTITFIGTPKLHGTNAGIVRYPDGKTVFQSRERELSLLSDNAGFMGTYASADLDYLFNQPFNEYMAVFGEWCGGNIQKGVALNQLPKMFVIFAVNVDGQWIDFSYSDNSELNIYTLFGLEQVVDIDFNNPDLGIVDELTQKTSTKCPFCERFGVIGIGEGYVWASENREYVFKSKNEEHKISSSQGKEQKEKTADKGEKFFVAEVCNENRLENVLAGLLDLEGSSEPNIKLTGKFITRTVSDIVREEEVDILSNQYDIELVKKNITNIAKQWFLEKVK